MHKLAYVLFRQWEHTEFVPLSSSEQSSGMYMVFLPREVH